MKKLLILLAVFALLPVATANADSIVVGQSYLVQWHGVDGTIPGGANNGGSFRVSGNGIDPFLTFCLEVNEHFSGNEWMKVTRVDNKIVKSDTGSPLDLPDEVAWLYTDFLKIAAPTDADANAYQAAIWYFVGHSADGYGVNNVYAQAASAAVGRGWLNNSVAVLGFDSPDPASDFRKQDMLTLVPEPGSMLLLGTGLIGLAAAARRRIRK